MIDTGMIGRMERTMRPGVIARRAILRALITALEDADCDTLDESWYSDHPMMRNAMIDLHPEYCDDGGGDA
jgi:hypothetical protein